MKVLYLFSLVFTCYTISQRLCHFFCFRFSLPTPVLRHNCLSYKSREVYLSESCEIKQTYICKNHLIF